MATDYIGTRRYKKSRGPLEVDEKDPGICPVASPPPSMFTHPVEGATPATGVEVMTGGALSRLLLKLKPIDWP